MFAVINAGSLPVEQSQLPTPMPEILPISEPPSIENDLEQYHVPSNHLKVKSSESINASSSKCSSSCNSTLSMLDQESELDDETFQNLEAYVEEIAIHLQHNNSKRDHYIQLALATNDGDKRGFLSYIFEHLPYEQKRDIGDMFIASENWQLRADGVHLIANDDVPSLAVANKLMDIFSNEENAFVKGSILRHLEQSSSLQGDTEVMHQLESVLYNGTDTSVRVAALKAKMQLSEHSHFILSDAVEALHASDPEFQFAGLVAISQVLDKEKEYLAKGIYIDKASVKSDLKNMRDLAVYDGDNKRLVQLVKEANAVYLRHFEN